MLAGTDFRGIGHSAPMSDSKYPRITVVTPSYKAGHLIEQTLLSVLDQSYPNLEYLVIDGGSEDGTRDVLERYGNRLAYWCSERDEGQFDAINKGFSRSTGDILCWLNADDMFLPRSLYAVGEIFRTFPDIEWISTRRPALWDANGYLATVGYTPGFSRDAFLDGLYLPGTLSRGHWIQQESTFWRRSLWNRAGARIPKVGLAGDFALWCSFYLRANLVAVEYPLAGFRLLAGQRSDARQEYLQEATCALVAARNVARWTPDDKFQLRYGPPAGDPIDKSLYESQASYSGTLIYKPTPNVPASDWKIHQYQFLP
jgi:glycosyltransferase involved in cell wall biosynthesis